MLLGDVEYAIRLSCAASFPADCDVASLPFYGGDNSAPAVSASCVWPQLVELLPVSTVVCLQVVVELLTLRQCQIAHTKEK